ncbi:MAG: MoaD/ThiS family protein [Pirellulales bacterium]
MRLHVRYTAQLRAVVGRAEEEVELPEGSSLADLLINVASQLPDAAAAYMITPTGDLQPSLLVAVNQAAVSSRDAAGVPVNSGDVVMLLSPIAGG